MLRVRLGAWLWCVRAEDVTAEEMTALGAELSRRGAKLRHLRLIRAAVLARRPSTAAIDEDEDASEDLGESEDLGPGNTPTQSLGSANHPHGCKWTPWMALTSSKCGDIF